MSAPRPMLVLGAGIAGVTAALEAAEAGHAVVLVEREASVGGRVLRNHQYFPKLCPPSCGMEINVRRLEQNAKVRVLVRTQVTHAARLDGGWRVTLRSSPAFVTDACTACGACSAVCPASVADSFNLGLARVAAIRLPHAEAWPRRFVLDRMACAPDCRRCVEACPVPGAIALDAGDAETTVDVSAVVVATGWVPYPLEKLPELGGGRLADVVSNVQFERMAAPAGPSGGRIRRPSDGRAPQRVAFVQCAGSRDVHHLEYCSAVCCLASMKQALYVKAALPEADVTVYSIDRRAPGRNEAMLNQAEKQGVKFIKGKVGSVGPGKDGALVLHLEDVDAGRLRDAEADLVVLATGMVPAGAAELPFPLARDAHGFVVTDRGQRLFAAGVAHKPEDVAAAVRDATGVAAQALCAARSL